MTEETAFNEPMTSAPINKPAATDSTLLAYEPPEAPTISLWRFGGGDLSPLFSALADACVEVENPTKDRTAKVVTKTGGSYTYDYADLATVLTAVRPVFAKHGLAFLSFPATSTIKALDKKTGEEFDQIRVDVETVLTHKSGTWVSLMLSVPVTDDRLSGSQAVGSVITYLRRYAIQCLSATAADADDDANAASGQDAQTGAKNGGHSGGGDAPISEAQGKLLYVELKKAGKTSEQLIAALNAGPLPNLKKLDEIPKSLFNKVLEAVRKKQHPDENEDV